MIVNQKKSTADARTRSSPGVLHIATFITPALFVVIILFGGGLMVGFFQSLEYLQPPGTEFLTFHHFATIMHDPDFFRSLLLTLYVALTSTLVAATVSIGMALVLASFSESKRIIHFIFQIPLTVPHLVIAVAVVFMMAPTGLFSRLALTLGMIDSSSEFPLLINDEWAIGIMLAYIWKEIPFITVMILAVLRNTGPELLEVSKTLKANRWQRFRYVILPIIFPSLGAACLIVFAYTFGAFEVPFLLGQTYPLMLPVWAYKNYSDVDLLARPAGIATGLIIAAVVIFSIVLSQILTKTARRRGAVL